MSANAGVQLVGFRPTGPNTPNTFPINLGTVAIGYGFVPQKNYTLTKFKAYISAFAGFTWTAGDFQCDIYADNGGSPNNGGASLGTSTTYSPAPPASNIPNWMEWSSFASGAGVALTAGAQYWAVITNHNATPAVNTFTFQYGASTSAPDWWGGGSPLYGWPVKTYNGATWNAGNAGCGSCRVGYSDGSYAGFPVQSVATSTSTQSVMGVHECGIRFTVPPFVAYNIIGLSVYFGKTGTPTGTGWVGKIYTGSSSTPTLQGFTATFPLVTVVTAGLNRNWVPMLFSSPITVTAGTVVRATMADLNTSQGAGNFLNMYQYTMDSDANSVALLPFEGTYQGCFTSSGGGGTGGGGTFTDLGGTPIIIPFGLFLDTSGEFASQGSGLLYLAGMEGGMP